MSERRLLIVRHPETFANTDGRFVGRGDSDYTPRGRAQVPVLGARIAAFHPARILSSPLRRTAELAAEAARLNGCTVSHDERLTELDFGDAEGLTWEETRARGIAFEFKRWDAPVAHGGESRRDIYERTVAVLTEVLSGPHERTAIVTHGGVFRSALPFLLDLPHDAIWSFDIRNGSVAECRIIEDRGLLVEFVTLG